MFVVFAFLHLFLAMNKPMWCVPLYFLLAIVVATSLGDLVARFYTDPVNDSLRQRWGEGKLGSAIKAEETPSSAGEVPVAR
jgi:hypothetical protein